MQCPARAGAVKEDKGIAETLTVSFHQLSLQRVLEGDLLLSECWQEGMDETQSFSLLLAYWVLSNITKAQRASCPGWRD